MSRKHTDLRTELIQTNSELLRNEQIITENFNLKSATFLSINVHNNINPPFGVSP